MNWALYEIHSTQNTNIDIRISFKLSVFNFIFSRYNVDITTFSLYSVRLSYSCNSTRRKITKYPFSLPLQLCYHQNRRLTKYSVNEQLGCILALNMVPLYWHTECNGKSKIFHRNGYSPRNSSAKLRHQNIWVCRSSQLRQTSCCKWCEHFWHRLCQLQLYLQKIINVVKYLLGSTHLTLRSYHVGFRQRYLIFPISRTLGRLLSVQWFVGSVLWTRVNYDCSMVFKATLNKS